MNKRRTKTTQHVEIEVGHTDQVGLERIVFFSDAVFAIAITLLTLEIRMPDEPIITTDAQLFARLTGMWHEYLAFLVSFMVIGTFWMAHHRKFRLIKRYDSRLIFLNLLLLMVIAFIPFPTSIISKYPERTATIFYSLTMSLAGLFMTLIWWYASGNDRLIDPGLDLEQRRRQFMAPFVTTIIFLLSIGITFLDAGVGRVSWLLILPASIWANKDQEIKQR